ncbi:putative peptidoglycan binding domain-containing protein [Fictibacillus macauensis ZFHKF-1]|uniref:Putative peptidoglycan binding domain-containing protein n=1 Tax=Fictibacillus macauensis ZFHKF-1 TaxID=1196324 RepID=I8AF76_9BACL|nr:L,D-transpeptidase family protein [Fictibacillus macauensis]EIT83994.1 putative peptidoglycan binding domain-containing protein [Fictibacillus macauensis ZFHKF-1]
MKFVSKVTALLLLSASVTSTVTLHPRVEAANKKASDDYIIINKTYNKLAYYRDKKLVRVYSVATGRKQSYTPEGKFKIVQKLVNRPYYKGHIPGGDPRNPLGKRWLGISIPNKGKAAGWGSVYGIHGNNNPRTIGKYASSGCIRMFNSEIEKSLYPKVLLNTPVYITRSYKSFAALAKKIGYIKGKKFTALTLGQRGSMIKELQQNLQKHGYPIKLTKRYDVSTKKAVTAFQKKFYLNETGIVDAETYNLLRSSQTRPTIVTTQATFKGWADSHSFEAHDVLTGAPTVYQAQQSAFMNALQDDGTYYLSYIHHQNGQYFLQKVTAYSPFEKKLPF